MVLVEGRQNHLRVSKFIYLFLYKNIVFTSAQFIYGFYCDWSAQTIYDDWYITLFNVLFTAFAISYLGAMDQDVRFREYCTKEEREKKKSYEDKIVNPLGEIAADDNESIIQYPPTKVIRPLKKNIQHFYYMTQKGLFFNTSLFVYEIIGGLLHGLIITASTIAAYRYYIVDEEGHNSDFWNVSIVIYTVLIIVTNLMTLIRSSHITWLLIFSIAATSIGPFIIFIIFYDRWLLLNV